MNIRFSRAASPLFHFFFQKTRFCLFVVIVSLTSVNAVANNFLSEEEKFRKLGNLVNTVMYMWNSPPGLNNDEITQLIIASEIQQDSSAIGKVIKTVLYHLDASLSTSGSKLPLDLVDEASPDDWTYLKNINASRYFALKAVFIMYKTANAHLETSERLEYSIPLLYSLKQEALKTTDHHAVAITSIWLAMEYSEINQMKAVVEIEYALPFLKHFDKEYNLETALNKRMAHSWLADAYTNLNIYSRAVAHQKFVIEDSKEHDIATSYVYVGLINSLNHLQRFDDAFTMVDESELVSIENRSVQQTLFSLWLRVSVYLHRDKQGDREKIAALTENLSHFEGVTLPTDINLLPVLSSLQATHLALKGSGTEFEMAMDALTSDFDLQAKNSSYSSSILLTKHAHLRDLHRLRGNFKKALFHQHRYDFLRNQPNRSVKHLDEINIDSPLQRDITINKLQEMARLKDKQTLKLKAERFQALTFALVAVMSTFLLFWFWRRQRSRAQASEIDDLTGALVRRAMFKAIAKPMSSKVTSCLVLLDLDHFKKVNDRYGHVVGDEVLTKFGKVVRQRIRKTDKFCRYGGEEFLLYLHDTTEENAKALLEDVKISIESHQDWSTTEATFSASFSAGVIQVKSERNINKIIKACDNLLYRAKSAGRGKIETMTFPAYLNENL
ncbi:Response regulator receiver modulated diguanylate cyclase [Alteromonas sp. 38]|uniref:GGDEF domain-containing protein n=1 Tax=unclassified Alteromonas TaxID=2614992 RepID=UPI0012F3567F|nr:MULTISPECIES: GGDEF domain-containing protein [unclassified Alteromonas]CAD5283824.1 Response regulator receiver modulated diguanylate cyclase [Alteromonas sp. 154]VXB45767.1 Response regulator receiver modulated diguanylate cyclase [Alteromonas sp. 38]